MDYFTNREIVFNWKQALTVPSQLKVSDIDSSLLFTDDYGTTFLKAGVPFATDNSGKTDIIKQLPTEAAVQDVIKVNVHDYKVVKNSDGSYNIRGVFMLKGTLAKKNMDPNVQGLYENIQGPLQSNGIYVINN